MAAVVRFDGVSKRFVIQHHKARSFQEALVNLITQRNGGTSEEFWPLKDVSFEVQAGETLGLIGENGAGKSTALKLLTRIIQPTSGKVSVNGKVAALIELGAGFHPDLTGRENIYLNGSILGIGRREMARKFDEIVAFSELERFIDTPVKHFSSGMYARLGFSVAVTVDPDILVVDEVLSVGDEAFQRKCLERIHAFRRRGKTILIVSHDMSTVESLCDKVVWLHGGAVREQGAAARAIRAYRAELQRREEQAREAARRAETDQSSAIMPEIAAGDVTFGETELRDVSGIEKYSFQSGETLVARFRFRAPAGDDDWEFGFELRRHDGLLVFGTARPLAELPGADAAGWREVSVEFPDLPLLAGSFELAPTLRRADAADHQPERGPACGFSVWGDGADAGLCHMAAGWNDGRQLVGFDAGSLSAVGGHSQ